MPYKIGAKLYQVKEGEYKYPYKIYKVPVQTNFFNHLVVFSLFVGVQKHIEKYDHIEHHTREYVEPVETSDKEKEVGK